MSSLEEASHFAKSRGTSLGRGYVSIDDCVPGVIVFIKKCQYIFHQDFVESRLSILALRHPALVIERVESKASHVLVCPLTTFGGRTVQERYPQNRVKRNNYLPIYPRSPITPRGVQLYTAGEPLKKPGYVNIAETYTVHTDMLRAYDWDFAVDAYRLTEASLGQVILKLRYRTNITSLHSVSQGTRLPLPVDLQLGSSIDNIETLPRDLGSERNSVLTTIQDTSGLPVSNSNGTETLLLSVSNRDIRCRHSPSIVCQSPRKLLSYFVLVSILFIIAYFVFGFPGFP